MEHFSNATRTASTQVVPGRVPSIVTAENVLRILPVVGLISAGGGVLLHEIGVVAYELRLEGLGVPPALFPESDASLVTQGYYAVTSSLLNFYQLLVGLIVFAVPAALLVVAWWNMMEWLAKPRAHRIDAVFARWPARVKKLIGEGLLAILIYLTIPLMVLLVMVIMIVPVLIGHQAAEANVAREREAYRRPCAASLQCVTLMQADTTKTEGYLIEASSTHLALHDPRIRRTLVIGRRPTDVLSAQIPPAKP